MNEIILIFLVLATGTWIAAAAGAALVIFVKKGSNKLTKLILGFAAGVILMISFIELIYPAIQRAEQFSSLPVWIVVPGAFAVGFFTCMLLDKYMAGVKAKKENSGQNAYKYKQGVILLGAFSAHSIPEGLALGILMGALGRQFDMTQLFTVIPIVIAVGLHKLPEGTAISVAFQKDGMSKLKSFLFGQTSGFFGFLAGVLGFLVAVNVDAILPYAMAFAGGAMIWVVVHELIPHGVKDGEQSLYIKTIGVFLGIMMMLITDITMHDHSHQHGPQCTHDQEIVPTILNQI